VSFAAMTFCDASQRALIVTVVYFFIDSVRKLLDTPSLSDLVQSYFFMDIADLLEILSSLLSQTTSQEVSVNLLRIIECGELSEVVLTSIKT
jgi:hypothetical protein